MSKKNLIINFLKSNTNYPIRSWEIERLAFSSGVYANAESIMRIFRKIKSEGIPGYKIKELPILNKKNNQKMWKVEKVEQQLELI